LTIAGSTAYLGFFECPDDQAVADELFGWARETAGRAGCREILGPVDASFWNRYRMKTDAFDQSAYFGEPRNPDYYPRLWERAGFSVVQRYSSTIFPVVPRGYRNPRLTSRLEWARDNGFRVESLRMREWDDVFPRVHALIMELYADMPVFQPLDLDGFAAVFGKLRLAADPELITLAWQGSELAAFSIVLPDFADLANPLRLLWRKHHYRRVVAAYMGAAVPGLGSALAARLLAQAAERGLGFVGSLMADGKPTAQYANDLVAARQHYALYGSSWNYTV
jgi:hypothetical protein